MLETEVLETQVNELIYQVGILSHEEIRLRSGRVSPYYFEFANILGHPLELARLAKILAAAIDAKNISYDRIVPVPTTPITIATALSLETQKPMLLVRKPKSYGNRATIEGPFEKGEKALVIEDVLSTGTSILRTVDTLIGHGLRVDDVLVIVDRNEGGIETFGRGRQRYKIHTLTDIVKTLNFGRAATPQLISDEVYAQDMAYYYSLRHQLFGS